MPIASGISSRDVHIGHAHWFQNRDSLEDGPGWMLHVLKKILGGYYRLLQILLTILMAGLLIPVTLQILSRYTGLIPRYIWTEEIARFCFIWIVMIGAMIAVRDGTHFDVDVLPKLGRRADAVLRLFTHVAMLGVALIFITYGYQFAKFGSIQTSEIAGLPMLSIYIAWPLAGLTWLAFLGEKFVDDIKTLRGETPPPTDHDISRAE